MSRQPTPSSRTAPSKTLFSTTQVPRFLVLLLFSACTLSLKKCEKTNCFMSSPDLWQEKFKDCRMDNTTFLHPKKGCHLNFKEENDIVIYMVSFLGSLAVLPGNIISALFMDKIGRIRIIGEISRECQNNSPGQTGFCVVLFQYVIRFF